VPEPQPPARPDELPLLAQRIASAIVGIPLILWLIYFGGVAYVAAVAFALAIASLEYSHMRREWLDPVSLLTAFIVAGICAGAYAGRYEWLAWLGAALVIPPLAAAATAEDGEQSADAMWTLGGVTYVGFLGGFIVLLRFIDFDARAWVYLALLGTFAVDTAAYFVGRAFGKHALAPRISPKKTVEGFAGGWLFGAAAVIGLNYALDIQAPPGQIALLAVGLPVVAAAGDLAESAIKRVMGVKDASELIPGHGGILDRLDSVLFTFALVYLFTQFVVY
jgi:phosphatidate cytidylyltransferase